MIRSYVGGTRILGVVSDDEDEDDKDEVIEDVGGDDDSDSEGDPLNGLAKHKEQLKEL